VHLAIEVGVFDALKLIEVQRERQGIPDELLLRTASVLPLVEAMGLSAAAGELFQDAAILLQLGYSIRQVQEGFNDRHHGGNGGGKAVTPCHPEVLGQELARIDMASLDVFRQECLRGLAERKLIKGKVCAVDSTGLGNRYRLVGLMVLDGEQPLWLSWRLLKGRASEKGEEACVVRSLVEDVPAVAGPEAIEWLLMDALYADGPLLGWLEYSRGIHALVRLPEDRLLYEDLRGLADHGFTKWQTHKDVRYLSGHQQVRQLSVTALADLSSWDSFLEVAESYGAQQPGLWGALVHAVDVAEPTTIEDWALVSTYPFNSAWAGYRLWRKRWLIENSGFCELKEGWHLEKASWSRTNDTVVAARVAFTLIAFNIAQLAKTSKGRQLTDRGIRRLRRELNATYGPAPS